MLHHSDFHSYPAYAESVKANEGGPLMTHPLAASASFELGPEVNYSVLMLHR